MLHPGRWLIAIVTAIGVAACGGDDEDADGGPPPADAATDADGSPTIETPAEPSPPAPPVFVPCPAGWVEQSDDEAVSCEPWPSGPEDCPGASLQLPGHAGCEPLGAPCPAGDYPEGLPDGAPVLYVRAGPGPAGDGSFDRPFATVSAALTEARRGTVVALSRGDHVTSVRIPGGVTVWGACADETRLVAPDAEETLSVVTSRGSGAVLRDVTVTGGRAGVRVDIAGTELRLEGVLIQDVVAGGIAAYDGGRVTGQRVAVRTVRSDAGGWFGRGLDAERGGQIDLAEVSVESVHDVAVFVSESAGSLSLTDAVVRRALSNPADGSLGRGLEVDGGAVATLLRVVIEDIQEAGVYVAGASSVTAEDLVVRNVATSGDGTTGRGLELSGASTLDGRRVLVEQFEEDGVFSSGGSSLTLEDAVVRRSGGGRDLGASGRGIEAQQGSTVELVRTVVSATREVALQIGEVGSEVRVTDVVLRGTAPRETDGAYGWGASVQRGARLTGARLRIEDCVELGVGVDASDVQLSDLVVRRIAGRSSEGIYGRALTAQGGAHVVLERAELSDLQEAALFAAGEGTELEVEDLVVRDMASSPLGPGRAIAAQAGAAVTGQRVRVERSREIALFAGESGSSIRLQDVEVRDVLERQCPGCEDFGAGIGVGAYLGASVDLRRFRIVRAALAGIQLARAGVLDLHEGEVGDCPIGANVQTEGFDAERLSDRVVWRDNGRNFDGAELPTPSADLRQ